MKSLAKIENQIKALDLTVINTLSHGHKNGLAISKGTKAIYNMTGSQFNQFLQENDLTVNAESIEMFLDAQPWKPATRNLKRQALLNVIKAQPEFSSNIILQTAVNEVFKKQVKRATIDKAITRDEYLTRAEIDQVKASADEKTALMIEFLFQSGCRISELIEIRIKNIFFNGYSKITVLGKGNKERTIYAKSDLIRQIMQAFGSKTWLFETTKHTRFNRSNLFRDIVNAGKKASFTIHPHTLRHSCAMHLKDRNRSPQYIQKYLGHSKVETTIQHYFHDNPGSEILNDF